MENTVVKRNDPAFFRRLTDTLLLGKAGAPGARGARNLFHIGDLA
jgi:hypothetical protein